MRLFTTDSMVKTFSTLLASRPMRSTLDASAEVVGSM